MDIAEIETLLKQTIGLDAASIGLTTIERAVQKRLAACHLKDLPSYLKKLHSSAAELQELIEAVVVSETWFFRDPEAFAVLAQIILQDWLPAHPQSQLRLLSIPCATGEEPYSLAMALDGIGVPPESSHIDAIDISEHALAQARKAVYGRNSFRGRNLDFRDRYFETDLQSYRLSGRIRRRVVFHRENLFDPNFFPESHFFHFIFCRNLLIYLDQAAQDRAIRTLKRLLVPDGLLFVGPAEAALMLNHDLVSIKRPLAFAFRHADPAPKKKPAIPKLPRRESVAPSLPVFKARSHLKTQRIARPPSQPVVAEKALADLKQASRMADEGRLEEAVNICRDYLNKHHQSVEAHHLLGVIYDAMGQGEKAGAHYRKALYLDPDHYESLVHLAYSVGQAGHAEAARHLHARASRLKEKARHV